MAGGKYTTYRLMSEQIVDRVLQSKEIEQRLLYKNCSTFQALNSFVTVDRISYAEATAVTETEKLLSARFGAESFEILKKYGAGKTYWQLEAHQAIYSTMCLTLVDFFTRRVPLMLSHKDHGLELLAEISEVRSAAARASAASWTSRSRSRTRARAIACRRGSARSARSGSSSA